MSKGLNEFLAPGVLLLIFTSSIGLVSFWCGRGRRIQQCDETYSLITVLAQLLGFTACDLSIDSLGALISHSIKPLVFAIENKPEKGYLLY